MSGLIASARNWLRRRKLAERSPADIFAAYARSNKWGDVESLSGKGSNLAATEELRCLLPVLLKELGATSMLDVPCGDFHWMAHVDLQGVDYLGGDIVEELVQANMARHSRPGRSFRRIDLISGPVPRADLVFVRDCLVHLSARHVMASLANIRASGSTWLLTTTFPESATNEDIPTGHWRAIDLTRAPFGLPLPVRLIAEGKADVRGQAPDKMLGLWRIADLPDFSGKEA